MWMKLFALLVAASVVNCAPTKQTDDVESWIKPNTPENIEKLKNLSEDDVAELYSGQYQGDIVISDEEILELEGNGRNGKTGLINPDRMWPGGIIPYRVNETQFNEEQIAHIHLGAQRMMDISCLKFVPYDPENEDHVGFITVRSGSGCSSSVGYLGREQFISLAPNNIEVGCFRLYTIVHEFLHAVGFYHMQSASDRDEFVRIEYDYIQAGTVNNFNLYSDTVVTHYNVEYDYGSCMHYPRTAFSVNGNDTIIPLKDLNGEVMGQRLRMSEKDIRRLNRRYCNEATEIPITSPPLTTEPATTIPPTTTVAPPATTTGRPRIPNIQAFVQSINDWANNLVNNIFGSFRFG